MSDLKLIEHRLPAAVSRYEWKPYVVDDGFTYEWWHRIWDLGRRYSLWSVVDGDVEVARIELDREVHYDHYNGVPYLGPRYDHPKGFPSYRPFFVAPEGWPTL